MVKGLPREALAHIDTAIQYFPFTAGANLEIFVRHRAYLLKADAFQQLGQLDSAIVYLKQGQEKELEFQRTQNLHKIIEIDNKYNVVQKDKELEAKNFQLEREENNRNWLLVLVSMAILFAGVLAFYYLKLHKANQKTQEQAKQLKDLDIAKSRFFANVSHELRTPLTLLLGPIHILLKENNLAGKQTQLLQMAEKSGKQLEQLINEILDLRKLEMGKMELDMKPTQLASFFQNFFAQFKSLAERKQIDFSFDTQGAHELVANIDQEKCRQMLNNLLSNAFKFTPAGGRITTRLSVTDGILHLSVADSGPGIHPDDLPHVFDRFFQTTRPDKPAEGGTGIGLNLCREYARLFGGTIDVESTLGQGSIFRVAFPATLAEDGTVDVHEGVVQDNANEPYMVTPLSGTAGLARPGKAPRFPSSGESKPTILVVEDNPDLQDYIRLILQDKYNVVTAEHGQAALGMMNDELLRKNISAGDEKFILPHSSFLIPHSSFIIPHSSFIIHHSSFIIPDVILSDLMMPVMDGYQLLEKLKSDDATRHIPVIMLTARAEARDKLKALRIGVDDYLTKPFDEEELLVRIDNLLKNQLARQEAIPAEAEAESVPPTMSQPDREWLECFETYVRLNYADDTLNVPVLAGEFAMSESTLLRQLKRLTGLTPQQYLQEMRLDEARQLLENRRYDTLAQVASKVGYRDVRAFSRSFRQRFGRLPSEMV